MDNIETISKTITLENIRASSVNTMPRKNRTLLAAICSFAASALAIVFVLMYWETLNAVAPPNNNQNTILITNPSDKLSEVCDNCGQKKENCTGHNEPDSASVPCPRCTATDCTSCDEPDLPNDVPHEPDIILSQERVGFAGDSALFLNPAEAEIVLFEYADELQKFTKNAREDVKVYIVGAVAQTRGSAAGSQRLSEERAVAVLETLVRLGVPEHTIAAFGMGFGDPWHITNFDEHGRFLEEYATLNRRVVIIMTGDDAMETLEAQIIGNDEPLTMFYFDGGMLKSREFSSLYQ